MKENNFSYSFNTSKKINLVFKHLLNVKQWWSGLFDETISGKSAKLNDEFTFEAGKGMHYSKQRLIELIPDKRIVWLVTDSELSFLNDPSEWKGTKVCFDLLEEENTTKITFTHEGLHPQIECFENCSTAWNGYMHNLKERLQ